MSTISRRALNRTLLRRQFLLEPTSAAPLDVVRHLVAMQGQEPNWPHFGLWARLGGYRPDDLDAFLREHAIVRAAMIRGTVHLAAAEDFLWLRRSVESVVSAALKHAFYAKEIDGLDLTEVRQAGENLLADRPLTRRELGRSLAERFPGRSPGRLADTVEIIRPLVHLPEAVVWGRWGPRSGIAVALAESWIGTQAEDGPRHERMIRRYLAAFGPASVMDVQAWSGVTRLREVVEAMRPELVEVRTDEGTVLYDLPDAPYADADTPAPVRFLPAFDNALLGHRDRTRVIAEEDRRRHSKEASAGVPMFLIDGFVEGTWRLEDSEGPTLRITPYRSLSKPVRSALLEEAERLLTFLAYHAVTGDRSASWRINLEHPLRSPK